MRRTRTRLTHVGKKIPIYTLWNTRANYFHIFLGFNVRRRQRLVQSVFRNVIYTRFQKKCALFNVVYFEKAYSNNSCASGHPTLPRKLPPTLTFFSDAAKKSGVSLCDPFSSKWSDELPKYHRNTPISWLFNLDF